MALILKVTISSLFRLTHTFTVMFGSPSTAMFGSPVVPNYHIESHRLLLCTSGLRSLRLHTVTLEQVV